MKILYELNGFGKEYYVLDNGNVMTVLSKKAWVNVGEKNDLNGNTCVKLQTIDGKYEYYKKADLLNGKIEQVPVKQVDRRKNEKQVDMLKDGVVIKTFNNANEASRETGIAHAGIYNCCNNNRYYKSAGGYQWKYAD